MSEKGKKYYKCFMKDQINVTKPFTCVWMEYNSNLSFYRLIVRNPTL